MGHSSSKTFPVTISGVPSQTGGTWTVTQSGSNSNNYNLVPSPPSKANTSVPYDCNLSGAYDINTGLLAGQISCPNGDYAGGNIPCIPSGNNLICNDSGNQAGNIIAILNKATNGQNYAQTITSTTPTITKINYSNLLIWLVLIIIIILIIVLIYKNGKK